jgi:hypothetical protein
MEIMIDSGSNVAEQRNCSLSVVCKDHVRSESEPTVEENALAGGAAMDRPSPAHFELVKRSPLQLRPHPALSKYDLGLSKARLSAMVEDLDSQNRAPICVTRSGSILRGLGECECARLKRQQTVDCLEFDLDEEQALRWILRDCRRNERLNDFNRIVLALELEPAILQRARENQRNGGQYKGSIDLSEAKRIDCRAEIAAAANVADVQVTKVKKLLDAGPPDLLEALHTGEVRIHRASVWLKNPKSIQDELMQFRMLRGITRTIDALQRAQKSKLTSPEEQFDIRRIGCALASLDEDRWRSVLVKSIRVPGNVALLSASLLQSLETQGELGR